MKEQYIAVYEGDGEKIFLSNEDKAALADLVQILEDNLSIRFEFMVEPVNNNPVNVYGFPQEVRNAYKD